MAEISIRASVSSFELKIGNLRVRIERRMIPADQMSMAAERERCESVSVASKGKKRERERERDATNQRSDQDTSTAPPELEIPSFLLGSPSRSVWG